ncbi:MAG: hypothetical protein JWO38_4447 [Gemmataceae bacterium]|nr:hypothetical protein [Gemmataceae bacterium]
MIQPFAALAILSLALVAPAQPRDGAGFFYPTKPGTKWTYQFPDADIVLVITKVEEKDGRRIVSVGRVREDGKTTPHEKVEVSDKGLRRLEESVFRVRIDGGPELEDGWAVRKPPLCLLKLPVKPDEKWEVQLTPELPATLTARAAERVKVPAGEFEAVPVDYVAAVPGREEMRFRYWYAPGVGVVKWTFGKDGEIVLKAFSRGQE